MNVLLKFDLPTSFDLVEAKIPFGRLSGNEIFDEFMDYIIFHADPDHVEKKLLIPEFELFLCPV